MLIRAIRALLDLLRPYPAVLPAVAALGVLASLAEGIGIGLMIPFLASLTSAPTVEGGAGEGGGPVTRWLDAYAALFPPDSRLVVVAATIAALVVLSCLVNYAYVRVLSWAAAQVTHDVRAGLFARFVHGDELFVDEGSQGRQVNAVDGAAYRVGQATIHLCLLVVNGCTVVVLLVLLGLISPPMTLVVLAGVAVAALVVRVFVGRGLLVSREYERHAAELADATVDTLGSLRVVRMFGQERREVERLVAVSDAVRTRQFRIETLRRAMAPLVDGIAAPLLVGGMVVAVRADIGIAVLLPFLVLVFRLQRYARELDVARVLIASNAGAVFDVLAALEPPPPARRASASAGVPFTGLRERIVLDDVSFAHARAESPSVEHLSFEVRRGETLAVVGGSGAGKSTLIDLLCGIHVPDAGAILIDGTNLADLDLGTWRARLGFAGQDAELRPGTVRENIAYGRPDAPLEDVIEAARQASAHRFVEALPRGYETTVGVRGLQLSGGERQRIALARALLGRPDVLILDEATNALDNATEALIRETLRNLAGSLTTIVIAHRLASIRHADRVVVMAGGRIVERGTPEALRAGRGTFSELDRLERDAP